MTKKTRDEKRRRPWSDTVTLGNATAVVLKGPGRAWSLVVYGERKQPARMKGGRS